MADSIGFYEALRILALREVTRAQPSPAYSWRRVARYYAETWHVPLPMVDDLPIDEVLQHYYESFYEKLEPQEREREVEELTRTVVEARRHRTARDRGEAADRKFWEETDAQALTQFEAAAAARATRAAAALLRGGVPPAPAILPPRPAGSTRRGELDLPAAAPVVATRIEYADPGDGIPDGDGIGEGLTGLKP